MTDTEVNVPLLRKGVEWVEAEAAKPYRFRRWFQSRWAVVPTIDQFRGKNIKDPSCGTCFCFAGYIASLDGEIDAAQETVCAPGEEATDIGEYAAAVLGLNYFQADRLFKATNTAADVRRIAEEIAGEKL